MTGERNGFPSVRLHPVIFPARSATRNAEQVDEREGAHRADAEADDLEPEQGEAVPLHSGRAGEQRHPVPLVLVFALMNRPYVLDLRPGHSFVEFMLKRGYDVYLLDWGVPGPEDKNMKLDDYILEYIPRAIQKVKTSPVRRSSACSAGASARF